MPEAGTPHVEPRGRDTAIVRVIRIIGSAVCVVFAVAIPALYYFFAVEAKKQSLEIETAYTAKTIQSIIFARPEMWEFETLRLMEIASTRTVDDGEDERTIYGASGNIDVETKYKAPAPVVTVTVPIFVSGEKVGTVRAKRSIRDVVRGTAFAGMFGAAFGLGVYLLFRYFPLRLLKEALAGLAAEREKFETTLSSIGDGVITVDREGRIAYMNPVAELYTGWRSDEAWRRDLKECYVTRRESGWPESEIVAPLMLLSRNGVERAVEEVWSPIKMGNSEEEGRVLVFRDVTEKRNLERQVLQAQKMESLGVMAGGIAHDFNNLLMVVLVHAELALNDVSPTSPVHGSLTEITTAARRAADLSRQMLAYAGKAAFATERVGMGALVEEMAHLLKAAISKKATLDLNLERGLLSIQADPSQIRQIVMNLIINASEAIGDRGGVITVSVGTTQCGEEYLRKTELHDGLAAGPYVYLEVADTGDGMDARTRSRIFEPFFSTKFTGRGLGLAAVLGIVRSHKGALKVHSEPGKGATFKVLFPALEDAGVEARDNGSPPVADGRGKGTILLVDDEESLLALGARMLELLGFTVLTAADGLQAVELYRERREEIDLVLMDLTMPRMDGAEAFGEMRRLNPHVRVVLASGYTEEDVSSRFEGKGPSGIIRKPYTLAVLREALRQAIRDVETIPQAGFRK